MRTERRGPLVVAVALAVVPLLTGCTMIATPATPGTSAVGSTTTAAATSAAPSPTPARPLGCDDLVPQARIAAALSGPDSPPDQGVVATSAPQPSLFGALAIEGAGGLSCSWTRRSDPAPDRLLFTVSVLPDAADDWSAVLYGDGPTTQRRTFAGVSAAAGCGDPGCGASMVVGSAWVRIDLLVSDRERGGSVFGRESDDTIFANARPAFEAVVDSVCSASPAALRFPSHVEEGATAPSCTSFLSTGALATALGTTSAAYDLQYQFSGVSDSITGAAEHRIATTQCFAKGSGDSPDGIARIWLEPGQAWAVAALAADPVARGALRSTTIPGQAQGEHALTDCDADGTSCSVVFSLGSTAIEIGDNPHADRIARAILAQAR